MRIIIIALIAVALTACGKNKSSESAGPETLDTPKMDCERVITGELHCQGKDPLDPNGVPATCSYYTNGTRQFHNGTLTSADAYDCGMINGERCFYFQHQPSGDDLLEDVVCQ